jgi:hypothetical protein
LEDNTALSNTQLLCVTIKESTIGRPSNLEHARLVVLGARLFIHEELKLPSLAIRTAKVLKPKG